MLEGVLEVGEQTLLVEELGGVQVGEAAAQGVLGQIGDGRQQREGHILADDRGRLEQPLLLRREAVDAGRQDRLHGARHLDGRECPGQLVATALADQHPGLHECPHALLEEEGIALGPLDEEALERAQVGAASEQ